MSEQRKTDSTDLRNKHKELADDHLESDESQRRRETIDAARRDADASFKIFKDSIKKTQNTK
jgi:hypothetical protein